jgi:signal transduction histidine kinase
MHTAMLPAMPASAQAPPRPPEDDVRAALDRERELSEMKSRFVALTSHELRTPLAAILSSVELLEDFSGRLGEEERREILGLIKSSVLRMNGLVGQVQLMSRLDAGKLAFGPRPLDVGAVVEEAAGETARSHSAADRIRLGVTGLSALRLADERLVRHIVAALLDNALKYSSAPVILAAAVEGDNVILTVSDQGIGVPASDLPRLYEAFHRGANVGNVRGTGVGLHIAHRCVELHGGSISVESAPQRGTTFRVELRAPAA